MASHLPPVGRRAFIVSTVASLSLLSGGDTYQVRYYWFCRNPASGILGPELDGRKDVQRKEVKIASEDDPD